MDRENKTTGQKDNLLVDPRGDLLPPIIRPEINSLNFPFFALHRRGLKSRIETVYRFVEERDGARAELEWRVTANAKYGHPSPFDYRVSRAVDALIYEVLAQDGYPLENPLQFSIYHLAELMGASIREGRSGWLYQDIKKSLKRITLTGIESKGSFYLKDRKRWIDDTFHLYERVRFRGEEIIDSSTPELDDTVAETNYLWLSNFLLRNINAQYVRPLDYKYLAGLKNIVASRLYEILSGKFFGLPRKEKHFQISYLTLCDVLPITPQKYLSLAKQQLKLAHDKLITTGFLSKVVFRKGKKDFVVIYYLGERAERERRGGLSKQIATPTAEGDAFQSLLKTPGAVIQLSNFAQELHERGISQSVAMHLTKNYPEDYIQEKIKIFDFFMNADDGTISDNPAGWLRTAIETDIKPTKKQVRAGKTAVRQQVEEQIKELELEKSRTKKPYEEKCNEIFDALIAEHGDIADKALQEARKETSILEQFYEPEKPFTEQMMMLQVAVRPRLREQFPDSFKTIDEEHKAKISEIDARIDALKTEAKNKIAST